MTLDPFIIINPNAHSGKLGKNLDKILKITREYIGDFQYKLTERGRHEVEIAEKAITDGYKTIVALGGDGTATNMGDVAVKYPEVTLGLLSAGSMCDWHRTHAIPYNLKDSLEIFVEGYIEKFPALKCSGDKTYYAFDMADGGFTAKAAAASFTEMKWLKIGVIKYNYLAFKYVIKFPNVPCKVTIDNGDPIEIPDLTNVFASFGDDIVGFNVLPGNPFLCRKNNDFGIAIAHDMKGLRRISMLIKASYMFKPGQHVGMKGCWLSRGRKMIVESDQIALPWETEGEIFNEEGFRAEIERIDDAINLVVPKEREYKPVYDESVYQESFEESFNEREYEKLNDD